MLSKLIRYLPIIIGLFRFLVKLFGRKANASPRAQFPPIDGSTGGNIGGDDWDRIEHGANSPSKTSQGLDPIEGSFEPKDEPQHRQKDAVAKAYRNRQSNVVLTDQGTVSRILEDDLEGDRHQKFIVRISRDLSILIAHNIDLAPRVPVRKGDFIRFKGEYEWDERGGYLHWTHHDPKGWHEAGWVEYENKRYG